MSNLMTDFEVTRFGSKEWQLLARESNLKNLRSIREVAPSFSDKDIFKVLFALRMRVLTWRLDNGFSYELERTELKRVPPIRVILGPGLVAEFEYLDRPLSKEIMLPDFFFECKDWNKTLPLFIGEFNDKYAHDHFFSKEHASFLGRYAE